jgi:hypothetical protein
MPTSRRLSPSARRSLRQIRRSGGVPAGVRLCRDSAGAWYARRDVNGGHAAHPAGGYTVVTYPCRSPREALATVMA